MQIYTVNATLDSLSNPVRRHFMTFEAALLAARNLVDAMRRQVDDGTLPPIAIENWQEGLREAQRHHLARLGHDPSSLDDRVLAEASGYALTIDETVIEDMQLPPLLDEREMSTILGALHLLGEQGCPDHLVEIATSQYRYPVMDPATIERLCDRFIEGGTPHDTPQIIVALEDRRVTGVMSDRPVTVHALDYDISGASDGDIRDIPEEFGAPAKAVAAVWRDDDVLVDPDHVGLITSALACQDTPAGAA